MSFYCEYYQARFLKEKTWFVVGCLRAESNLVFDRATAEDPQVFEFFVPPHREMEFLAVMNIFEKKGYVFSLEKKLNRMLNSSD